MVYDVSFVCPEVLKVPEEMCYVLLCSLEAVTDGLCLPKMLEVPELMRCALFWLEAVESGMSLPGGVEGAAGAGGNMLYAALFGCCGDRVDLFR
jgi:hypothetical protein